MILGILCSDVSFLDIILVMWVMLLFYCFWEMIVRFVVVMVLVKGFFMKVGLCIRDLFGFWLILLVSLLEYSMVDWVRYLLVMDFLIIMMLGMILVYLYVKSLLVCLNLVVILLVIRIRLSLLV